MRWSARNANGPASKRDQAHDRRCAEVVRADRLYVHQEQPALEAFQPYDESDNLFEQEEPGNAVERFLVELPMMFKGSREGGFFTMIGRKN